MTMQTSVQVFLAFAVIYMASVALPFDASARAVGWTSQAAAITAAVATFAVMRSHRMGAGQAAIVLAAMTVVAALAAMAIAACEANVTCQQSLQVHTLVFATGVVSGAAAYVGFLAAAAAGLSAWATAVVAIACAPLYLQYVAPALGRGVERLFARRE